MALCPGLPRWDSTRRDIHPFTPETFLESVIILDFMRRGEDNGSKCTDNLAGRQPVQTIDAPTSIIPQILRQKPFLRQPSQFILARDRHQNMLGTAMAAWNGPNKYEMKNETLLTPASISRYI